MKKQYAILSAVAVFALATFMAGAALAQDDVSIQHGPNFVDTDGDGYNDNAPDADGDGIPNGQDPDYVPQGSASGQFHGRGYVDADGDGFNDNAPDIDGDGIPNGQDPDYVRPGDGTGRQLGRTDSAVRARNSAGRERGVQRGDMIRGRDRLQDGSGAGTGTGRGAGKGRGRD